MGKRFLPACSWCSHLIMSGAFVWIYSRRRCGAVGRTRDAIRCGGVAAMYREPVTRVREAAA